MSKIQDSPSNVYKQMVQAPQCLPEEQPVLLPRNVKQIKNLQAKDRQSVRLTHDALYNVHELAYDLEDFVYKIITFPDLIIVCGLNVVLQELTLSITADQNVRSSVFCKVSIGSILLTLSIFINNILMTKFWVLYHILSRSVKFQSGP